MHIHSNFSLRDLNSFGLDVTAKYYVSIQNTRELQELIRLPIYTSNPTLILGGGSNLLFLDDFFDGLVVHVLPKGITMVHDDGDQVMVRANAGENWHNFVLKTIEMGVGGLENLSLIPGQVGAAPIQNIGAYGVELKDVFHSLEALELATGKIISFTHSDCDFGYRSSIFKREKKKQYVILSVDFLLKRNPELKLEYGSLQDELGIMGVKLPDIRAVSEAVCRIRRTKLPNPVELGNAGSFFKNPVVPLEHYEALKKQYPDLVAYPDAQGMKLAAGWLIEKAGWKGKREGDAGMHTRQALVLVNYGKSSGKELYRLAMKVRRSISDHFGVLLEPEVNIIGYIS